MQKIVVTGGSGQAGRAVVRDLVANGYEVRNVDVVPSPDQAIVSTDPQLTDEGWVGRPFARFVKADLTDLGQVFEVLRGADAVVHLAAIARPGLVTPENTFRVNVTSSYNVFQAAIQLKLAKVVWASSETALGLPLTPQKVHYAPIDEAHPLYPESSYALSKVVIEEMARHLARWSGMPIIGLRYSNLMEIADYANFPNWWKDVRLRMWNLWGYIDARDAAQCTRRALESDLSGAEVFIVAAADTCMNRPNREIMAEAFPGVPLMEGTGDFDTLLSIKKAREMLGYAPQYSWRDHVTG